MKTPSSTCVVQMISESLLSPSWKVAEWDPSKHPRDEKGQFAPNGEGSEAKAPGRMIDRIGDRRKEDPWGYFGDSTQRNQSLDHDVDTALNALGVPEQEAEDFLTSRMGRHLSDAVHHLKPDRHQNEVARQVKLHLGWFRESNTAKDKGRDKLPYAVTPWRLPEPATPTTPMTIPSTVETPRRPDDLRAAVFPWNARRVRRFGPLV